MLLLAVTCKTDFSLLFFFFTEKRQCYFVEITQVTGLHKLKCPFCFPKNFKWILIPLLYCSMRLRLCKSLQFCLSPSFCQCSAKQPHWLLFSSHIDKMCFSLHDQLMVSFHQCSIIEITFLKAFIPWALWSSMRMYEEGSILVLLSWKKNKYLLWMTAHHYELKIPFLKNLVYSDLDTWVYYEKKWDWRKEVALNLGSRLNYRCKS